MDHPSTPSRSPVPTQSPAAEPVARLPVDLEEDPADESIYSTAYRLRIGAVLRDGPLPSPAPGGVGPAFERTLSRS
jgi:hypothetical protein